MQIIDFSKQNVKLHDIVLFNHTHVVFTYDEFMLAGLTLDKSKHVVIRLPIVDIVKEHFKNIY